MIIASGQIGFLNGAGIFSLLAIALVVLCLVFGISAQKRLSKQLLLTNTRDPLIRAILGISIALLLGVATLQPFWGSEDISIPTQGDDLIFLVDISRSMYATDVAPSRLEVAKRKIKDLVTAFNQNGAVARFGITVFSGDGYTVCPITTDRAVINQFIDQLSPDLVSSLGSNLGAGIHAALSRLDETAKKHSRVILISDGEDNFINAAAIVRSVSAEGVRFDVLGIGTPEGATIQLPNGAALLDSNRRPVVTSLKESPLQAIAQAGRGTYIRATIDDSDINTILRAASLGVNSARTITEHTIRSYGEVGPWIVCAALGLLVFAAFRGRSNPLLFIALQAYPFVFSPIANAEEVTPSQSHVERMSPFLLYQQGDYQGAVTGFQSELKTDPSNRELKQGLASSLYRLGRYSESAAIFEEITRSTKNGRHYFEAAYNQGNALIKLGRYQDAIDSFHRALDVKPDDEQALHNLSVARALLEEQKRRDSEATPTPTHTPTSDDQGQSSPSPEVSQSATAEPSPSPSQSPHDSPEPQDGTANSTPSPDPNESEPSQASPSPVQTNDARATSSQDLTPHPNSPEPTARADSATAAPNSVPTPAERLKEALDKGQSPPELAETPQAAEPTKSFSFPEVDAWLQSLPESPLLIRQHRGTPPANGQTW